MRINQFVANASGLSRRAADAAISAKRVTLNGQTATLGQAIDPNQDDIRLDGKSLKPTTAYTYLMLNKPTGYVSSRAQQGSDPTLYELIPPVHHRLRIVGRLDRDSSGLILLTDDGNFIQHHLHPSFEKSKIYELTLARPLTQTDLAKLERGVKLTDGISRLTFLAHNGRQVKVSLSEGRNRQLRRSFGVLGYTVDNLNRLSIGPYQLGGLPSGHWQPFEAFDRA